MILEYLVTKKECNTTVNNILKNHLHLSRKQIARLKAKNYIYLNNINCHIKVNVKENDIVKIQLFEHITSNSIIPTPMAIDILYEDEYIIVLNKPKNTLVHPVGKEIANTLSNGIKYYFAQKNIFMIPRPVGRLDRNTTGVIVFAKNSHVHSIMVQTMNLSTSYKRYIAITKNSLIKKEGIIDLPIKRMDGSIITRIVSPEGKKSITKYKIIETYNNFSLIQFELLTGRTHQIRVHCKQLNIPIIGDTLYGDASDLINRQALHSHKTFFIHPFTQKETLLFAPIPNDMLFVLDTLKKH